MSVQLLWPVALPQLNADDSNNVDAFQQLLPRAKPVGSAFNANTLSDEQAADDVRLDVLARLLPLSELQSMQGLRPAAPFWLSGLHEPPENSSKATQQVTESPEALEVCAVQSPVRCTSPNLPAAAYAAPSSRASDVVLASDGHLAEASLHVLLGCADIIPHMLSGKLRTHTIRPAALQRLLRPVCTAGLQRAQLTDFLAAHGVAAVACTVDAAQQEFVQAVSAVLAQQSQLIRGVVGAVAQRRQQEQQPCEDDAGMQHSVVPTLLEVVQHTRAVRRQTASLAKLCWCYAPREPGAGLRWQTCPFPCGNELLSHVHQALTSCGAADAPMLRFVFGATVQQLLADVMCWAHSLSRPPMSLTSGHAAPQAGRGDGELEEDAITALLHTTLQLPTFLAGMRNELHMAGCQLRFLASLSACRGACEALQRSAEQQVALLRTCSASGATEKPSAISGNASGGEGSERWRYSLAWDWDGAVRLVGAFASAQTERRALVQGLLDDLAAQRATAEDEERAEALRAVQERQAQALAEEQGREAARIAHAERKLRLLREQQAALDDREHARRDALEQQLQEERRLLQAEPRSSVAQVLQLTQGLKHALLAEDDLRAREQRMAWRLQRWDLFDRRRRHLEAVQDVEAALIADWRCTASRPPAAAPARSDAMPAPSTAGSSAVSRAHSVPGTFVLSSRRCGGFHGTPAAPRSSLRGSRPPSRAWARERGSTAAPFALHTVKEEPHGNAGPPSELTLTLVDEHNVHAAARTSGAALCSDSAASAQPRAGMTASLASAQSWATLLRSHGSWPNRASTPTNSTAVATSAHHRRSAVIANGAATTSESGVPMAGRSVYSLHSSAAGQRTASVFDEHFTRSDAAAPLPSELVRESVDDAALSAWGGSLLRGAGTPGSEASRIESRASSAASQASVLRKAWLQPGRLSAAGEGDQQSAPPQPAAQPHGSLPVQRVVADALLNPILAQYRLVSAACIRVVLDELRLLRVCDTLRSLMLAGDSGLLLALLDGIEEGAAACDGVLTASRLQAALDGAAAGMPHLRDPHAPVTCSFVIQPARQVPAEEAPRSQLQFTPAAAVEEDAISLQDWNGGGAAINPLFDARDWTVGAVAIDAANVRALDALKLVVRVGGPLRCVLTPASLSVLSEAFTVLLRTRWLLNQLGQGLLNLHKAARTLPSSARSSADDTVARKRLAQWTACLQAAVHAMTCFDAHLHDTAVESAYHDFTRDASTASDLLCLCRRFGRFAHECARACTLAHDGTLATAVLGVTEACTVAARLTHAELLPACTGVGRGACGALVHKVMNAKTWGRMEAALGSVKQRVEYLQKRLRYRAARGLFEEWHAAMSFKCL